MLRGFSSYWTLNATRIVVCSPGVIVQVCAIMIVDRCPASTVMVAKILFDSFAGFQAVSFMHQPNDHYDAPSKLIKMQSRTQMHPQDKQNLIVENILNSR